MFPSLSDEASSSFSHQPLPHAVSASVLSPVQAGPSCPAFGGFMLRGKLTVNICTCLLH